MSKCCVSALLSSLRKQFLSQVLQPESATLCLWSNMWVTAYYWKKWQWIENKKQNVSCCILLLKEKMIWIRKEKTKKKQHVSGYILLLKEIAWNLKTKQHVSGLYYFWKKLQHWIQKLVSNLVFYAQSTIVVISGRHWIKKQANVRVVAYYVWKKLQWIKNKNKATCNL